MEFETSIWKMFPPDRSINAIVSTCPDAYAKEGGFFVVIDRSIILLDVGSDDDDDRSSRSGQSNGDRDGSID